MKSFMQLFEEARTAVSAMSPAGLADWVYGDEDVLVIDVRDSEDIEATGRIPGSVPISTGGLLFKADPAMPAEVRDARLQDQSRRIVVHCQVGPVGAISAMRLTEYGFENVQFLDGGMVAWLREGRATEPFTGRD